MSDPCERCGAINWRVWIDRKKVEHQVCQSCGDHLEGHTFNVSDPKMMEKVRKLLGGKP